MCQHAIPYCRLFADQVRPWVDFAIWTEQPTWTLRTFQKDAKTASPIKDKSHKTPESAPAAGDLKPACDDLALEEPGNRKFRQKTENFAKKEPGKNRGMGQNLPKMQFYRILMWKVVT